ncbi:MAG: prenyltransferase/squalene oxidase repeat-containing protein [Planctomycetota bacterium]
MLLWKFAIITFSLFVQDSKPASNPTTNNIKKNTQVDSLIAKGVEILLATEDGGTWTYEGVYRESGEIPIGYRVGGTAIVCNALLHAAKSDDKKAAAAIDRGVDFILQNLGDEKLAPSTIDRYDVRIWGQSCSLELFCHLKMKNRLGPKAKEIEEWMPKLVATITTEEIEEGGWNYASRKASAPFVTAPVAHTLLFARAAGLSVSDEMLTRARDFLKRCRLDSGAFVYDERSLKSNIARDQVDKRDRTAKVPGAVGRSPVSEATLMLLGDGNADHIKKSIDAFFEHWGELEKRRAKTGTHIGTYGIAPYYFYYAHRYTAMAIELLPKEKRDAERKRLLEYILKTKDEDGSWNDRHFPRSKAYGTAMVILALLRENGPMPQRLPDVKNVKRK